MDTENGRVNPPPPPIPLRKKHFLGASLIENQKFDATMIQTTRNMHATTSVKIKMDKRDK